jgi:hypothetical protein
MKVVRMTESDLADSRATAAKFNDTPINFDHYAIAEHQGGQPAKLKIGTQVVFTNDYGISFVGSKIIRVERDDYGDAYYTDAVYITKADGTKVLQWSPYRRRQLTIQAN